MTIVQQIILNPLLVQGGAWAILPLSPEGVGAGVESILQFETRAQGSHVTPARSSSPEQTIRGGGGGQGATAVAGGRRHQLRHTPAEMFQITELKQPQWDEKIRVSTYLNIAQAFLQVGNHLREFRPILILKKRQRKKGNKIFKGISQIPKAMHTGLYVLPVHPQETKVNPASINSPLDLLPRLDLLHPDLHLHPQLVN